MHMEDMFNDLMMDILQGLAKFRTPGMWNKYFRWLNWGHHGSKGCLNQLVLAMLCNLHAKLLDGFAVDWHK